MRRPARPRIRRWLVLLAAAAVLAGPSAGAAGDWEVRSAAPVAEGVTLSEHVRGDPLRSLVLEVAPGAPARIGVIVSSDRVDGAREPVSSMCARSGAVACVNAHFATCPSCGQPSGSIVRDGVVVRTGDDHFGDVAVIDGRLTSEPWPWSLSLRSSPGLLSLGSPADLSIDGVNTEAAADGIVAYTPDFGPRTPAPPGAHEIVVRAPEPLRTGPDVRQPVGLVSAHRAGAAAIPSDGMVLSGLGSGAERLQRFVAEHGSHPLELVSNTPAGLEQSVAGHPVLLRDGHPQPLDTTANRHVVRHPRTVIGWDGEGTTWLVVVDGRQRASRGIGLADIAAHLQGLGATDAVNLDGGGSSTLVTRCPYALRLCVRNRPSGGRERPVTTALVLHGSFVAPPPPPTTAPPPPPPPPPGPALSAEPPAAVAALELSAAPPGGAVPAPAPHASPPPEPPDSQLPPADLAAGSVVDGAPGEAALAPAGAPDRPDASGWTAAPEAGEAGGTGHALLATLAAALLAADAVALRRSRGTIRR